MRSPLLVAALCGLSWMVSQNALAANPDNSPLHKFEKGAQPPPPSPAAPASTPEPAYQPSDDYEWDDGDDFVGDLMGELLSALVEPIVRTSVHLISQQSQRTLLRLAPVPENTEPRHDGDSLIPFVRYDYSRQNVASGIDGGFHRLETGYGPAAVMYENYRLRDTAANATLTIERYLFLYRFSSSRRFELDFGLGRTVMYGATITNLSTTSLAARYMFGDHLTLELRPTWADTVTDFEASLAWSLHYGSLKAGYRTLDSAGGTLQGPFVGFAVHF